MQKLQTDLFYTDDAIVGIFYRYNAKSKYDSIKYPPLSQILFHSYYANLTI